MMRLVTGKTYKMFAKRYKIQLSYVSNGKRYKKTMKRLAKEIYEYERDKNLIGLYFTK